MVIAVPRPSSRSCQDAIEQLPAHREPVHDSPPRSLKGRNTDVEGVLYSTCTLLARDGRLCTGTYHHHPSIRLCLCRREPDWIPLRTLLPLTAAGRHPSCDGPDRLDLPYPLHRTPLSVLDLYYPSGFSPAPPAAKAALGILADFAVHIRPNGHFAGAAGILFCIPTSLSFCHWEKFPDTKLSSIPHVTKKTQLHVPCPLDPCHIKSRSSPPVATLLTPGQGNMACCKKRKKRFGSWVCDWLLTYNTLTDVQSRRQTRMDGKGEKAHVPYLDYDSMRRGSLRRLIGDG
ncbi:hypothetical protein VTK26DRAFT_8170 [Humicola hyalothermophila]